MRSETPLLSKFRIINQEGKVVGFDSYGASIWLLPFPSWNIIIKTMNKILARKECYCKRSCVEIVDDFIAGKLIISRGLFRKRHEAKEYICIRCSDVISFREIEEIYNKLK